METLSQNKEVKAIKEHRCNFCNGRIMIGETYITSTHKTEDIYTFKTHKECQEIASRMDMYKMCDEDGLTQENFQIRIEDAHDDLLISLISKDDRDKYADIIRQLKCVRFKDKLGYVIRHYAKIDKQKAQASVATEVKLENKSMK